jgi:uridine kinase
MTANASRAAALNDLATALASLRLGRPVRIAVDGRTAAGKTTLANELADIIARGGREVIRTSIDGFHRPRAERYARGRFSPEGYYHDARDHTAIRALLLAPLGPDGNRRYRTASFDLENDRPVDQAPQHASPEDILIVDGTFLQRPELRGDWDLAIFIETTETAAEQRGIERDTAMFGGTDAARRLYAERYRPAFRIYEGLCAPASIADVVFNNDVFESPRLRVSNGTRLPPHGMERLQQRCPR